MTIRTGSVTSKFFLIIALAAFGVVGFGITHSMVRRAEVNSEIAKLKEDISGYESSTNELGQLLNYMGTNEYQEKEARLRSGLQKPGEQVVVIPGLVGSEQTKNTSVVQLKNWQRWVHIFLPDNSSQ